MSLAEKPTTVTPRAIALGALTAGNSFGAGDRSQQQRMTDMFVRVDADTLIQRMRPTLEAEPRVAVAWLFGSAARGSMRPDSDVDVALVFRDGCDAPAREAVLADLASRLEASCSPHPLELIDLAAQGPVFVHRALVDGKRIVVNDNDRRATFEGESHVRYFDWKPTWDLAANEQQAGMRRWLARQRRA